MKKNIGEIMSKIKRLAQNILDYSSYDLCVGTLQSLKMIIDESVKLETENKNLKARNEILRVALGELK